MVLFIDEGILNDVGVSCFLFCCDCVAGGVGGGYPAPLGAGAGVAGGAGLFGADVEAFGLPVCSVIFF